MGRINSQPVQRCTVALQNPREDVMAPAYWLGQFLALTAPAGKARDFAPVRGLWVITHRGCGMSAATLRCTKQRALAVAKAWDQRFGCLNPADARSWPHAAAWGDLVRRINSPAGYGLEAPRADGGLTDTAGELAANAGIPIDQAGGKLRILWRGKFWPAPTNAELDYWTFDSVCETPDGRTVEPDAPDSWLRILRLV